MDWREHWKGQAVQSLPTMLLIRSNLRWPPLSPQVTMKAPVLPLLLSAGLLFVASLAASQAVPAPAPAPAGTGVVVKYFFNASMVTLAPDGFQRDVITLSSGQTAGQGPTIECNSGESIIGRTPLSLDVRHLLVPLLYCPSSAFLKFSFFSIIVPAREY